MKDKSNDENNTRNNRNPFAKLFSKKSEEPQQQQQQQATSPRNPDDVLKEYLQGAGLYEGIDMQAYRQAVADGDHESADAIFKQAMFNASKAAIAASKKLMDAHIEAAKSETRDEVQASNKMELAVSEMQKKLPFTREEEFAPVAEGVLKGFMEQGFLTADAIKHTEDYFKTMAEKAGAKFPSADSKGMRSGKKGFNEQNENSQNGDMVDLTDEPTLDYVDILTGGNQNYDSLTAEQAAARKEKQPPPTVEE